MNFGEVEVVIKNRHVESVLGSRENPYGHFPFTAWIRVLEDGEFKGLYIDEDGIEKRDDIWTRFCGKSEFGIKRKVKKALRKNRRLKLNEGTANMITFRLPR